MSVRDLGRKVAIEVNTALEPLGFKRKGAMFIRDGARFGERYAIDGSRWNSGHEPWEFSVEAAVFFPDIPPVQNAKGLWRYAHAVGSTDNLAPGSPSCFLVSSSDFAAVAARVVEVILAASRTLPSIVGPAYERARRGLISPLPVPETCAS